MNKTLHYRDHSSPAEQKRKLESAFKDVSVGIKLKMLRQEILEVLGDQPNIVLSKEIADVLGQIHDALYAEREKGVDVSEEVLSRLDRQWQKILTKNVNSSTLIS